MGREDAADELQVVGRRAERVGDAAVPPGEARARLDGGAEARDLVVRDLAHRDALHDQVGLGHRLRVGVHGGRLLDAHLEALLLEERDEALGRLDGLMAVPSAAHDEGFPVC